VSDATFFSGEEPLVPGGVVTLGEDTAHHARVRRLAAGAELTLTDGAGHIARASLIRVAKGALTAQVSEVRAVVPSAALHLLAPIADRDRMLWLAEKAAELRLTSWRPVLWRRSRSVKPRGEGPTFTARVRQRMIAALEQCDGAWLPTIYPDAVPERALAGVPEGGRVMLDASGPPVLALGPLTAPVTLAVGPEGGFDDGERELLARCGFRAASVGTSILRFETAGVAAMAVARAVTDHVPPGGPRAQ
jgi:16S rRNA (uracil1498-N3)-methyltransferase